MSPKNALMSPMENHLGERLAAVMSRD
jgi:hypothetical protein